MADKPSDFQRLDQLKEAGDQKAREFQQSAAADERNGLEGPSEGSLRLLDEFHALGEEFTAELKRIQERFGVSDGLLERIEQQQRDAILGDREDRWWQRDIAEMDATDNLDDHARRAVDRLLTTIDSAWLTREAEKPFRLGSDFLGDPLHIVNGGRVLKDNPRPQRFGRMLLVALDHLNRRDDLDFFEASWAVPELTALGDSLDQLTALGPEATRKLHSLPTLDEVATASTIYELLVGAALVRRGRDTRMLPEDKQSKVPDFEITGMGVPMAVECKRKLGLYEYELQEAHLIEAMYAPVLELLLQTGRHISLQAVFTSEVADVKGDDFAQAVEYLLNSVEEGQSLATNWGSLHFETLPYYQDLSRTRLYAPNYLEQVFGWSRMGNLWDGLLCRVESPDRVMVTKARNPNCLKWVSLSDRATVKKARGVSSVWGDAARQFRPGEMGLIYIAYTEGGREAIADARTKHILEASQEWYTRWSITPALTVVNRLYPRAVGVGMPDLIESSIPMTIDGDELWLGMFPVGVFARRRRSS